MHAIRILLCIAIVYPVCVIWKAAFALAALRKKHVATPRLCPMLAKKVGLTSVEPPEPPLCTGLTDYYMNN
jgi:hypothetical protein